MFSSKSKLDPKKSVQKFLDLKKDLQTRQKHLKFVLENLDGFEKKCFFEHHASHIMLLFSENFSLLDGYVKQKGIRAAKEEVESVLSLLQQLLLYIPETLRKHWHYHTLYRVFLRLLHYQANPSARKDAIKLFITWYQILGEEATNEVHAIFATLIPGFESPFPGLGINNIALLKGPSLGPICDSDILPLIPAVSGDRVPDDLPRFFLEGLLRYSVSQLTKIQWRDKTGQRKRCFNFLFESFKKYYVNQLFPNFRLSTSIYKPSFELPPSRRSPGKEQRQSCRVEVIKWLSNFIHVPVADSFSGVSSAPTTVSLSQSNSSGGSSRTEIDGGRILNSTTKSDVFSPNRKGVGNEQGVEEIQIVQEVLFGSRANVNFIHEIMRQAFILNFSHSLAICRVIGVYKDWIMKKVDVPPFALEPVDHSSLWENNRISDVADGKSSFSNASGNEAFLVRAGMQNVLQTFVINSSNVFMLDLGRDVSIGLLEEQVDICRRVLNIYRWLVMKAKLDQRTWDQLLFVLLHITSEVLGRGQAKSNDPPALQDRLADAILETLIVTWIRANLQVAVSGSLWDLFVKVLSSLSDWETLVLQWAGTMDRMTRILAKNLYKIDMDDLPLSRLTERKVIRQRGNGTGTLRNQRITPQKPIQQLDSVSRCLSQATLSPDCSGTVSAISPAFHRRSTRIQLRRTYSEGCNRSRSKVSKEKNRGMADPLIDHSEEDEYVFGAQYRLRSYTFTNPSPISRWYSCDSFFRKRKNPLDENDDYSHCPSPTSSSGVESSSIRDTHHDALNSSLDNQSLDTIESAKSETSSVMLGGVRRGWLPDSAALLWQRMLCSLGDVNEIESPAMHALVFKKLLSLADALVKIRNNQGVSLDNLSTPPLPEFIPPLHIFIPWCLKSFSLPDSYASGKLHAMRLLCFVCVRQWDIPFRSEYLTAFYQSLFKGLTSGNQETLAEIFRACIPRFFSLQLTGYSLLVECFLNAASTVISSSDYQKMPRKEAVSLLGSLLFFPELCKNSPVLDPDSSTIRIKEFPDFKDKLVALLLRAGKREPTPLGRCISLCSLAIYIYKELEAKTFNEDVKGALYVLLNALRQCSSVTAPASGRSPLNRTSEFRVKKVAQIACDMLYLVSDHALTLTTLAPSMAGKIIEEISATLANLVADIENGIVDEEKRLLISLELCLAEWCMKLPAGFLLQSWPEDGSNSLLDTVLQVLKATKSPSTSTSMPPTVPLDGFENDTCREDNNPGSNSSTLTPSHTKLNASISRKNRGNHKTEDNLTSVKMGAQFVMDHLLNQLGHYPLGSDPARHTSMVSEGDDLASLDHSNSAFNLHNVQIFVLNGTKLLSFVELPTLLGPGGGVPFGLLTDKSEVRIIVRDLNGKHCWDSAILYNDTSMCDNSEETPDTSNDEDSLLLSVPGKREDIFSMSSSMINERFLVAPHNTVRHRPSGELPSWVNTEQDMDNLHDVLSYVKYTSSEVTGDTDLTSPRPPPSCITTEMEEEAITFSLSERTHENDFIEKFRSDVTMVSHPHEEPEIVENHMPFHMCRMFMSQLGLLNVESRPHIQLLKKNDQLIRELRNLDNQKCRETHKIAVIYVAQGQEDKVSILSNGAGSSEFEDFVARLGWEIELESHKGFMGGLQRNGTTGETAPYYATSLLEIIFHVSTRMPSDSEEGFLQKTRHLGNDEVHIVWSEHTRDYRRGIIPTEFCDVLIIIYPLPNGLFRIQVSKKQDIPFIGPLFNESIVDKSCLPGLVRATALNASRAKRSLLPLYQTFFEERNYALQSLVEQFALPSSFEEFSYQVITPSVQGHFQPVSSRMSSGSLITTQLSDVVTTLSLHSNNNQSLRQGSFIEDTRKVSDVSAPEIDESPKPSKRLSFKHASRFVSGFGLLPDVSPVTDQKRFPK
ncbi:ral GTPase-activating protein subunit alpha-1-like [Artemia franciscana]|uniref:ral GTPase-activating protein subunit alpha-1-like n=1 Tax=Artemia franciscana TaxID=6661 RepID=UPI0032DB702D